MPAGVGRAKTRDLPEELQTAIAEQSGLGYTVGVNFVLEQVLDFGRTQGSNVLLAMFRESGTVIRSGRYPRQEWSFRFIRKGSRMSEARRKSDELAQWLENTRRFETLSYRVIVLRFPRQPTLLVRGENGIVLFDFVVTLLALSKVP